MHGRFQLEYEAGLYHCTWKCLSTWQTDESVGRSLWNSVWISCYPRLLILVSVKFSLCLLNWVLRHKDVWRSGGIALSCLTSSKMRKKKDIPVWCVRFNPCTKLRLHRNHRSGHLKTEHTESLLLLRRHLGNWPRGPAVSMRSELLVAREKLGQFPLLTAYVMPV
jgi:hypothetical protein